MNKVSAWERKMHQPVTVQMIESTNSIQKSLGHFELMPF